VPSTSGGRFSIRNLKTRRALVRETYLTLQLPLGRPRLRWRIILKLILRKYDAGMGWIDLAQDGWRALVIAVMNLWVP